ncbi:hypothetical protein [Vibrio sp. 10N.261.55.A7]|uniref:hypothetical protein n=1 Tax=Vibrio sp. 10N.261.55.A7 TaxID=1880851 RepID=UPI000C84A4D2|nr:hypothetical protein [Vibrio sp. 10N.261.55.A7]PMJ90290.1 hypothetical protein BCU12_12410 [Vibrio sp. 10N.261.55.A7]
MSSAFDYARSLLRASITDSFGYTISITASDGEPKEIKGYIQSAKRGNHTVHRLITSESLPESCSTVYRDLNFMLVYEQPVKGNGTDSQISNEYVMVPIGEGASSNGWSEFTE